MEICEVCGLPKEICTCALIAKEKAKIRVKIEKKRYGKVVTVVEGIDSKAIDVKQLLKEMKTKLACGGTSKEDGFELQGDHREKVKQLLIEAGFKPESIELA